MLSVDSDFRTTKEEEK